jgi:metal-dependent hydrolases of the beta-lactamase superfamily III|nr:MBL fold metallo-hydrolase [uncultured Lachnoanaerobaculum sp.]
MELKFTGIGAAYYPVLGSNCAFFEHDNCLYLIDCGESTFKAMFSRNEIYDYDNIVVLLTHLHADHIGSLGSFLSFCKNVLDKKVLLAAEEDTIVNILDQSGVHTDKYNFTTDFKECEADGLSIYVKRESHATDMLCCGFIFECNGEKIYYSGDTSNVPSDILNAFLSGEIKTMYQECTFLDTDSTSHYSLKKLCEIIPYEERQRVYCMHLGDDIEDDIVKAGFRVPKVV